jgi:hypothetical protein
MKKQFHYLSNQVKIRTKGRGKLMVIFASDHKTKLEASKDADIVRLFEDFLPVFVFFLLQYDSRISAKAARKSATAAIKALMTDLKKNKVPAWDVKIQTIYPKKSPGYIALLPLGRKGLNTGGIEKRLSELSAFISNCGDNALVAEIKTAAQAALAAITAARELQQSKEGLIAELAVKVEEARINLADYIYRNLGFMMYKFFDNPSMIEAYFEFPLLRQRVSKKDEEPGNSYSVEIEPSATKEAGFAFEQSAKFYFYNYGEVPVTIYTGEKGATEPEGAFVLEAGAEADKPVTELGPAGSRYLYFSNHSETTKAMMEVVLI